MFTALNRIVSMKLKTLFLCLLLPLQAAAESPVTRVEPPFWWTGFEDSMLFESLKSDIDRALGRCGIPLVDQPFRAHLTLGRVRSIKDLNGFYDALAAMKDRFFYPVLFDRLIFYRSKLGEGPPVYTPLYQMEFKDLTRDT